jgi:hypothetical protein
VVGSENVPVWVLPEASLTVTWNVVVPNTVGSPKRSPEECSVIPDGTWRDDQV